MPRRKYGRLQKSIPAPGSEEKCGVCRERRFCAQHGRTRRLVRTTIRCQIEVVTSEEGPPEALERDLRKAVEALLDEERDLLESGVKIVRQTRFEYEKA